MADRRSGGTTAKKNAELKLAPPLRLAGGMSVGLVRAGGLGSGN